MPVKRLQTLLSALLVGALVGILGGLIGLGGAEFRLPLLVGMFGFRVRQAVVINLLVSFVTVCVSLAFRASSIPVADLTPHWPATLTVLVEALAGSYAGVQISSRVRERTLHRAVGALLICLSGVLILHSWLFSAPGPAIPAIARMSLGIGIGIAIGLVSSLLGVAGGELIIPTLVLLFGIEIKLAEASVCRSAFRRSSWVCGVITAKEQSWNWRRSAASSGVWRPAQSRAPSWAAGYCPSSPARCSMFCWA